MILKKLKRKNWIFMLLFNGFLTIILISSYHTTNRLSKLKKARLRQQINLSSNVTNSPGNAHPIEDNDIVANSDEILILFWNKYFDDTPPVKLWTEKATACVPNCKIVADRRYLSVSNAVIFHSRDLSYEGKDAMPSVHPEHQSWIYMQQESPSHTRMDLKDFPNVFNWTMTYRRDSDIYFPYGSVRPRDYSETLANPKEKPHQILTKDKTKLVAWIVSNCETEGKREDYVSQLENHISVDIYGKCGFYTCTRSGTDGCFSDIEKQYKFYLSFENSLCSDYITEKFFIPLKYNLIPIVYGGGDYQSIAPPHSFINANDFASPQALADYLLFLDKNDDKYLKYFEWKSKYKIGSSLGWCALCLKVQHQMVHPIGKVYPDLWDWWYNTEVEVKVVDQKSHVPSTKVYSKSCRSPLLGEDGSVINILNTLSGGVKKVQRWFRGL